MPPKLLNEDTSDFEKLAAALGGIASIRSIDDVLASIGLADLPTAQRYGILFGITVFSLTMISVLSLLVFGGTFKRLQEQAENGEATIPDAVTARESRPLLLEKLLDAQKRMMESYPEKYGKANTVTASGTNSTPLTKMLSNVAPRLEKISDVADLVEEDDNKQEKKTQIKQDIPKGYKENYVSAYRRCQDKPGGPILAGLPEARFEAYARAYAGCGIYTTTSYNRSYARMYEKVCCENHATEKKYSELYHSRPEDIIGRVVRLEALDAERHAQYCFDMTCGDAFEENQAYNPNKVWGFREYGPFNTKEELVKSPVFFLEKDQSAFAIVESVTDKVIGIIHLVNDDPKNLSIQIEAPIMKPSAEGTVEQLEGMFLLLDRLFALGYRRIQLVIDSQDTTSKKIPGRLGFTQEGLLPKHKIAKESSIDSIIYGMLNSDWNKGARGFLFKKLHGSQAENVDKANEVKESELEDQQRQKKHKAEKSK